jgi:LysM repeat protein
MSPKKCIDRFIFILLIVTLFGPVLATQMTLPITAKAAPLGGASAADLIMAMNTLRVSNGLPALVEDPIIDAVAQATAETMAAAQMSWHIGNAAGRIQAAGYGGGAKVWATENFAVGMDMSIDQIMIIWSDASHMIPAVTPAYCHVGAGTAQAGNGSTYYILQAAYTSTGSCGPYTPPSSGENTPGSPARTSQPLVSQLIVPVKVATPDADGKIYHVVQAGQSFWAIAVAYKVTIKDLEIWNNLSRDVRLQVGQKLFIPSSNTAGYATPTPVGMIQLSTPDADGKIVHTVQAYQALITIAQAYGTTVDKILALNGIKAEWPLQIGQKLVIHPGNVTPSPTPRPLKPVEKLTPASDGKYYHVVKSGESLSWIAQLYEISAAELMAWNGLDGATVIYPDQKLVLQVTPPATITPTPGPATATPTETALPPTPTATETPLPVVASPTVQEAEMVNTGVHPAVWAGVVGLLGVGAFLAVFYFRRKSG